MLYVDIIGIEQVCIPLTTVLLLGKKIKQIYYQEKKKKAKFLETVKLNNKINSFYPVNQNLPKFSSFLKEKVN